MEINKDKLKMILTESFLQGLLVESKKLPPGSFTEWRDDLIKHLEESK